MLKTVVIAENPLEPCTWDTHEVEDVLALIRSRFPIWPESGRIYHKCVSQDRDVTPVDKATLDRLSELEGPIFVVIYPSGAAVVIALIAVAISLAAVIFLRPKIPETPRPLEGTTSVNNSLDERKNVPRPKERIPDIFGTVRATPDLIAVPYRIFKGNQEFEYSYMCLGRGTYDLSDLREDTTLITALEGTSVRVYGPNTSPNSGSPQAPIVGDDIGEGVQLVVRNNSVNDYVLKPPNVKVQGVENQTYWTLVHATRIAPTATLTLEGLPGESLRDYFRIGSQIQIAGWQGIAYPYVNGQYWNAEPFYLDGVYTVTNVTDLTVTFNVPADTDLRWNNYLHQQINLGGAGGSPVQFYEYASQRQGPTPYRSPSGQTYYEDPRIYAAGWNWVGPFYLDNPDLVTIQNNFVSEGLFKENGISRVGLTVGIRIEVTPINASLQDTGPSQTFDITLTGSGSRVITKRGVTDKRTFAPGRYRVRAVRTTDTPPTWDGTYTWTVVDQIKWVDLYGMAPITVPHFGDVTTIQIVTRSSEAGTSVTRKFNCKATRKIPQWDSAAGAFTTALYPTSKVEEILPFVCLDPYIGGRTLSEIDVVGIRAVLAEVVSYFGHAYAGEFNYSFDDADISFEETVEAIASAVFCIAYRRGSQIKLSFEKLTPDSVLLFNHRNKIPGSETRTIRFGNADDNDGIEYSYVDGESYDDEKEVTLFVPSDGSSVKPKRMKGTGVRHKLQAYFHAWRLWNKMKYQNTTVEFEATEEANLLLLNDRILVADNTRPNTQDGQVEAQNVLELTLSQDVTFEEGEYHIFLQHIDRTTQSIVCTPGSSPNKVVLASPPLIPLSLDNEGVKAGYLLVGAPDSPRREMAFLVNERETKSGFTSTVKAINADDRYYEKDQDYNTGIVDSLGNPV